MSDVTFGKPLRELPHPRTNGPLARWELMAAEARKNPGAWVPVTIAGISQKWRYKLVTVIRKGQIHPFECLEFDATCLSGQLYIQWKGPQIIPAPHPRNQTISA